MFSLQEQQIPMLSNAKSADCLKLDLNYKMSKKSEIKLLNAKIKKLKSKCKALREESKTDRQILSNLINVTSHLQSKTNQGIQACKEVSDELLDNHDQLKSSTVNQTFTQMMQTAEDLALQSNCNEESTTQVRKQLQSLEQILESLPLQKSSQYKNALYNVPTDRSITASLKSQGNASDRLSLEKDLISASTESQTGDSESIKRANTISFSPGKSSKVQRRYSLPLNSPIKRNNGGIKLHNQNMFVKYIYAIICTIVLTIIFFKGITF